MPPPPAPPTGLKRESLLKAKARLEADAKASAAETAGGAAAAGEEAAAGKGPGTDCVHPLLQRNFPFLCAVTYRNEDLQTCSLSKSVRFCGRAEQKLWWKNHKDFCQVWGALIEKDVRGLRFDAFVEVAVKTFEEVMGRQPDPHEAQQLLQIPRCYNCGALPASIRCERTCLVGFCSEECRAAAERKFPQVFDQLQHTAAVVQLLCKYGRGPGAVSTVQGPLSSGLNWDSYLSEARVHLFDESVNHAGPAMRFAVQDSLSCPLVLLEGLERSGRGDALNRPKATVELLGASGYEFDAYMKWEELLNRCPKLQDLTVRMIGPEALTLSDSPTLDVSEDLSERNRRAGRTLVLECASKATRVEEWPADRSPATVRAAFNCGFAEPVADYTWPAGLKAVADLQDGVPLVFTSLTPMDAAKDLQVALRAKLRVLLKPSAAAFASPLALPDLWEKSEDSAPVFAFNSVVGVVAAP